MNIDVPKHVKRIPARDGNGLGAALREAVSGRYDRIPDEMSALLQRLERSRRAA